MKRNWYVALLVLAAFICCHAEVNVVRGSAFVSTATPQASHAAYHPLPSHDSDVPRQKGNTKSNKISLSQMNRIRELKRERGLAEAAAYDAAIRLREEEDVNARFQERLNAAGLNAGTIMHPHETDPSSAMRAKHDLSNSERVNRVQPDIQRAASHRFEVIDGSLSAVSGNEMADGVLQHVIRDPMEDGILSHFKSETFDLDSKGPVSGKRSTYEVIDGSLAAANDNNQELVNGVLSKYKQSKRDPMGILAQVNGEDRDGSLAETKGSSQAEGALARVAAEDPVGVLHTVDSSRAGAQSNAVGVLSTIDAKGRPFRKEEDRLHSMKEEHQEFESEENRLHELDKITRAQVNTAEKRRTLERLKRWEREVRELGEMQAKKLDALRTQLQQDGVAVDDESQDEAALEEANAARHLRAEMPHTSRRHSRHSRVVDSFGRPEGHMGKLQGRKGGQSVADAPAAPPSNTTGAESADDSDIGWVKTKWTALGWAFFVIMGPVATAAVTGMVSVWAGPIAAICTCLIMIAMDIASYYYSWYTF